MGKIIFSVFVFSLLFFSVAVFGLENDSVSDVSSSKPYEYTLNFYLALTLGFVGLLILVFLIISFIKSPKNKWKR